MTKQPHASVHQRFSSNWGLLISVLAIAVGTGNIWRFPRIAAQMGGDQGAGAFLVAWVVFLFLWSIPLMIAEYALGRRSRLGVVGVFMHTIGPRAAWLGAFVAFVTAAITFYYAVVVGWCLYYFVQMLVWPLPESTEAAERIWSGFQGGPLPMVFHVVVMALAGTVAWRGIQSIERANKILMPTMLATVLIAVVRAVALPGSMEGLAYLFRPEWGQLAEPRIWLEALTQNAWDTGAGWGLILTYAAHMRREQPILRNAFTTGIGNNLISLLAAVMVFGTLFGVLRHELGMAQPEVLEIARTSGPASTGLTLIWMPQLFARMTLGRPLAVLFFLGLALAGFTSLMAQLELQFRVLVDAGWTRPRAMLAALLGGYLLGIPSARSVDFLSNQDFVWGVALMLSGALIALAVLRHGAARLRKEELDGNASWWDAVMRYFVPPAAVVLLVWWLSQADLPAAMTCLVQWAVMAGLFLLFNRRLAASLLVQPSSQDRQGSTSARDAHSS